VLLGAPFCDFDDVTHHQVDAVQNIIVRKANDFVTFRGKLRRARGAVVLRLLLVVLAAIKLDAQLRAAAFKVEHVASHRRLTAKRQAMLTHRTQVKPQAHFRVRHLSPHRAREKIRHSGTLTIPCASATLVLPQLGELSALRARHLPWRGRTGV